MRRSAHPRPRNNKQRALPYRLRVLREFRAWSRSFADYFPPASELAENPRYWNWKVPIDAAVVEGDEARFVSQRELAQYLIDACAGLLRNTTRWRRTIPVTSATIGVTAKSRFNEHLRSRKGSTHARQ
ncbi:DUF3916 domain-containing protein [Pseudomonas sp. CGJS7]|uniref:DUF3916 domain-containing protein n=1 Tax=Pseudomonas sp. CGJS7 TaxID=3109348 RepID=UPI00300B4012